MKAVETITNNVGGTTGRNAVYMETRHALGLEPNSRYALMAVKLPDGYRLATEDDRTQTHRDAKRLIIAGKQAVFTTQRGMMEDTVFYAVPITPPAPVIKITVDGSEVTLSDETVAEIRKAVAG